MPPPESADDLPLTWGIDELVDRFARPSLALARRILGDDGLAEEVVQEVFLDLWRRPGRFDPARGTPSSWVLSMVHHKAVDVVRREQAHRRRLATAQAAADAVVAPQLDVTEDAETRAEQRRVRTALAALPELQREALVLAYFGGFTQREVGAVTGAPLGTVKSRMWAGMATLRAALAPQDDPGAAGSLAGLAESA